MRVYLDSHHSAKKKKFVFPVLSMAVLSNDIKADMKNHTNEENENSRGE